MLDISLLNSTIIQMRGVSAVRGIEVTLCGIRPSGINICTKNDEIYVFESGSIEVDGDYINIYEPGTRELSKREKTLLAVSKSLLKREDKITLGGSSVGFYRRREFFEKNNAVYLMGIESSDGKMMEGGLVRDSAIRGELKASFRVMKKPEITHIA